MRVVYVPTSNSCLGSYITTSEPGQNRALTFLRVMHDPDLGCWDRFLIPKLACQNTRNPPLECPGGPGLVALFCATISKKSTLKQLNRRIKRLNHNWQRRRLKASIPQYPQYSHLTTVSTSHTRDRRSVRAEKRMRTNAQSDGRQKTKPPTRAGLARTRLARELTGDI